MDDKGDGLLAELENVYCPPLDPALFSAIAFDFDLEDASQAQQCRDTLDTLKLSALEQEDLPFDPSGTSGLGSPNGQDLDGIVSERSASQNDTTRSRETDMTSLASEFSAFSVGDKHSPGYSSQRGSSEPVGYIVGSDGSIVLSGTTQEDKLGYLTEMFPSVDPFSIRHTLDKSGGDVDRSMDVLLNLAFFDEQRPDENGTTVSVPKGIDGFVENANSDIGRKKGRKRKARNLNSKNQGGLPYVSPDATPAVNKWDASQKDVEFICSRTSPILKRETVTSAHHSNGASLSATIRSLAVAHAPKEQAINEDPVMVEQVAELTQEFSSVPSDTLAGLLRITRNSASAANELAAAMVSRPAPSSVSELIKITTTNPPLDLGDEEPVQRTAGSRVARDYNRARNSAGLHYVAGADAFSKASTAYRRGRSDRMMGGAAAYYSAVGRDHLERAKRDASAAADALVDSQSGSSVLDLHGVSVQDAVRIASERVWEWWESLGDSKYMRGARPPGYRIVTGVGRHSHDGTSRLGPAVAKTLAREGWRVEIDQGVLTVVGIVRHS
ncbi:Smr domain-containing protein [Aspergillus sp. HF37]|nr:Smr domain-containing protein [Aspergillus sp. HF37]